MKLNLAFAATAALAASNVSANDDANELIKQEKDIIAALDSLNLAAAEPTATVAPVEAATMTDSGDLILDFDDAEGAGKDNETAAAIMPEMVALSGVTLEPRDGHDVAPEPELYDSEPTPELISESPEVEPVMVTVSEGGSVTATTTEAHHESKHQHKKSEKARAKAAKDAHAKAEKEAHHSKAVKKEAQHSMSLPHHKAKASKAEAHHSMSLPEKAAKATKSAKHSKKAKSAKMMKDASSMPTNVPHAKAHKNPTTSTAQEYAETVEVLTTSEDTMDNTTVPETKSALDGTVRDAVTTVPPNEAESSQGPPTNADSILAAVSAALSEELAPQAPGDIQPVARTPDETPDKAIPADKFTQEVKEVMLNGAGSAKDGHNGHYEGKTQPHHMKENVDKLDVRDKPRASNSLASDAAKSAGSVSYARGVVAGGFCLVASSVMAYAMLV